MSSGGGHGGGFSLPYLHELHEWMEGTNEGGGFIIPGYVILGLAVLAVLIFHNDAPMQSMRNWGMVFSLGPLWIPVIIGRFAMLRFIHMRRAYFNYSKPSVLLELKIPREILKSPRAMETALSSLNINPGEGTWFKRWWWGRTRPWWSLELVSIEGNIHFYIYTRQDMRRAVETSIYAQYPEIQIIEAEDYARLRDPSLAPYAMFACEYKEGAQSPYPIKTYVDYGLDKPALKVEEQIDPLAQILELFGSLGSGEQLWTQIIIRVAKSEKYHGKKNAAGAKYTWKDEAKEIVEGIRAAAVTKRQSVDAEGHVQELAGFPNPTEVQKETMAAVERNVGKLAYDVGIRSIYSAPVEKYKGLNPFVANMFKPVNTANYNSINPAPLWSEKFNDFPWEDIGGYRQRFENKEVVEFYRYRSYFHPPYRGPWMTMSTEELATIYHIPSSIVKTPSLPRMGSATAAPPTNLPQ